MKPELRALFPITDRAVYLNHAAISPLPVPTLKAVHDQLRDVQNHGSLNYGRWLEVKERARRSLAKLLGARPDQIAFMRNTSDGLSTVANGINWGAHDNIVTFRGEFPSNMYPWLRIRDTLGVEVRMCEETAGRVDVDELERLIDYRTRVVAISHVQYASGFRIDLERIGRLTRQHGALLVVDVIQSLGVISMDVESEFVDVAAGACHKWLLTPEGVGYLYLSDRAREIIEPTLVGWVSVPHPEEYSNFEQDWNHGALAWETGTGPSALIHGLEASLNLLLGVGINRISSYLEEITDQLCEGVLRRNYEIVSSRLSGEKSQIVCVRHKGDITAMGLYTHLKQEGIITAPRGDRLRIAPHFYNTTADIEQLLTALP